MYSTCRYVRPVYKLKMCLGSLHNLKLKKFPNVLSFIRLFPLSMIKSKEIHYERNIVNQLRNAKVLDYENGREVRTECDSSLEVKVDIDTSVIHK